jgi:hypothetical protein
MAFEPCSGAHERDNEPVAIAQFSERLKQPQVILMGPRNCWIERKRRWQLEPGADLVDLGLSDFGILECRRGPRDHLNFLGGNSILFDDILLNPFRPHDNCIRELARGSVDGFATRELLGRPELWIVQMLQVVWVVDCWDRA